MNTNYKIFIMPESKKLGNTLNNSPIHYQYILENYKLKGIFTQK